MARIKTNGAELKRFWTSTDPLYWPEDSCVDGMSWQVNGEEKDDVDVHSLADEDVVVVEGAIVHGHDADFDFAGVLKKWRKAQTHLTLAVEVPVDQQEALAHFLKGIKGKIIGR